MYVHIHHMTRKPPGTHQAVQKNSSRAVRIAAERAYDNREGERIIGRQADASHIRPARRRTGDALGKFAGCSPGLMREDRGLNGEGARVLPNAWRAMW